MHDEDELCPISALPAVLLDNVARDLHSYSTGLIAVTEDSDGRERATLFGSGTFISVGDTHAILTAAHVADSLPKRYALGLELREGVHRYTIESQYLKILRIARGSDDSQGPDLACILLPPSERGTVAATKSFLNLERDRERLLSASADADCGVWALCGFPDIRTTNELPEPNFSAVKGYRFLCGFGGVRKKAQVGSFDYLDFEVDYHSAEEIPLTFGGVSGGGLWQVRLRKTSINEIVVAECILSGIAFYETAMTNDRRTIRCHGSQSLYRVVVDRLHGTPDLGSSAG